MPGENNFINQIISNFRKIISPRVEVIGGENTPKAKKKTEPALRELEKLSNKAYDKGKPYVSKFKGLKFDLKNSNDTVKEIQKSLKKLVPAWDGWLKEDGTYGNNTKIAVEFLQTVFNIPGDGSEIDQPTAEILEKIQKYQKDSKNNPDPFSGLPEWNKQLLRLAQSQSYPFKAVSLEKEDIEKIAKNESPFKMVIYKNQWMQAQTALNFINFESKLDKKYPNYSAAIIDTAVRRPDMSGRDPFRNEGREIKFIIYDKGASRVSYEALKPLEKLCEESGFNVTNFYNPKLSEKLKREQYPHFQIISTHFK